MDVGLLKKLFGTEQQWQGACTVVLDAGANVTTAGADALGTGGVKYWAPRTTSGRVSADAVCMLKDATAVVLLQLHRSKTATGEEQVKPTLTLANPENVVAIEYLENFAMTALAAIGLPMPAAVKPAGSQSGVFAKPKIS